MPERAARSEPLGTRDPSYTGHATDEKPEKPDRHGEWLADDARIWRVYERLAKQDDDEKVKRWSGGLNSLAIFATLFAGITTAFLIESQGDLKPDFAELAYRVQNATAHGRVYVEEPFAVPGQARVVNCLWIASLLLSLSAALIAVMGQDWVEMYVDKPVCNPRQWAEIRSFRLNGVHRWYMPGVIATAPVLLHASFFLFGIGIAVFMSSDVITQNLCVAVCAIVAFLYAGVIFSPVLWSSSPFRSPATMLLRRWVCTRFQRTGKEEGSIAENPAKRYITQADDAVRRWIKSYLSMAWTAFDLVLETCGARVSNACTAVFHRWSRLRDSFHGRSLLRNMATRSPEIPVPVSGRQAAPPGLLPDFLSRFPTTYRDHILARYGPDAANVWTDVLCQWFSVPPRRDGSAIRGWARKCYSKFHAVLSSILDSYGPDASNGWSDTSETPLLALVADSLSWLSSASSSPEVSQLVVAGLCDYIMGSQVAGHANARSLTQKLYQYADGHWEHMSILDLFRYVIVSAHAGRRDWPDRVTQRFTSIIGADDPLPQDFLLALVHITTGFRSTPLVVPMQLITFDSISHSVIGFERLCARIPERDRSPITLPTIASIVVRLRPEVVGNVLAFMNISLLMNKWCNALPADLRLIDQVLSKMLPEEAHEETNKLATLCKSTLGRPIDNILHSFIAAFTGTRDDTVRRLCGRSTRDFAISLERRVASEPGGYHSCLAVMFGKIDRGVTAAAWRDLPAHDIEAALILTCRHAVFAADYHADLRPMLTRMIARYIRPPFPLLASNISARALLPCGKFLFDLVDTLFKDRALPDDLFRPVLRSGALTTLAAYVREAHGDLARGQNFLWILIAIARWITSRSDVEDRRKLFVLFTGPQTITASDSAVWDLVDAIAAVLETAEGRTLRNFQFCIALERFTSVITGLRGIFPGPECTLWESIARKFAANEHRFGPVAWPSTRALVIRGTGIDPEEFATENLSRGAGSAVQGDDSAPGSSSQTIEPTNSSAGVDSPVHSMHQTTWIVAGGIPHGGP